VPGSGEWRNAKLRRGDSQSAPHERAVSAGRFISFLLRPQLIVDQWFAINRATKTSTANASVRIAFDVTLETGVLIDLLPFAGGRAETA
jgi:hypothetical protein